MDRRVTTGFDIPAASLALFNTLSIIVLIPLYDRGLVPMLRRCGTRITLLQRIGATLVYFMCPAPLHPAPLHLQIPATRVGLGGCGAGDAGGSGGGV